MEELAAKSKGLEDVLAKREEAIEQFKKKIVQLEFSEANYRKKCDSFE